MNVFVSLDTALHVLEIGAIIWFYLKLRKLMLDEWRIQHRLRTPAAVIYGTVETLLLVEELPSEAQIKIYQAMLDSAQQLLDAIDAGHELARTEDDPKSSRLMWRGLPWRNGQASKQSGVNGLD